MPVRSVSVRGRLFVSFGLFVFCFPVSFMNGVAVVRIVWCPLEFFPGSFTVLVHALFYGDLFLSLSRPFLWFALLFPSFLFSFRFPIFMFPCLLL